MHSTDIGEDPGREPIEHFGMPVAGLCIGQCDPRQQELALRPDWPDHVASDRTLGAPERIRATSRLQAWLLRDMMLDVTTSGRRWPANRAVLNTPTETVDLGDLKSFIYLDTYMLCGVC